MNCNDCGGFLPRCDCSPFGGRSTPRYVRSSEAEPNQRSAHDAGGSEAAPEERRVSNSGQPEASSASAACVLASAPDALTAVTAPTHEQQQEKRDA